MRFVRTAALAAALLFPLASPSAPAAAPRKGSAPAPGAKVRLTPAQMSDLARAVREVPRADSAVKAIAYHLSGNPDSSQIVELRMDDAHGQVTLSKTYGEISFAVTNMLVAARGDTLGTASNLVEISDRIVERVDCQHMVRQYCNRVLNLLTARTDGEDLRAGAWEMLGRRELAVGNPDTAVAMFERALPATVNRQRVLRYLGHAHERSGEREAALAAYLESAATWLGADTTAAAPLRMMWADIHGSLAGLDEALAAARDSSHRGVVFDSKRWEKPAPDWSLPDLSGKTLKLSELRGKIVVLNFWGSWCAPCRAELPLLQKLQREFGGRGVEFVAANWEKPTGTAAERAQRAKDFASKEKLSLTVVLDHDRQAIEAYQLPAYPTTYVIDRDGTIRYRNAGHEAGADQVIREQLEGMLKAQ